jgi:HSP20 family protein
MTLRSLVPFGKKRVPVRYYDDPFTALNRNMDSLFENFFSGFDLEPWEKSFKSFTPNVEVSESDKEINVTAELPGMDEKDIDISLTHEALTISGEKKDEKEDNGNGYYMKERSYGSFKRTIPLYSEINSEKVNAHFKKGVLKITLPKSAKEVERKKKIPITS